MEFLDKFSPQLSPVTLGVALIAFVSSFWFLQLVLGNDAEAAVDYTVPIPEQCKPGWKGEELEDPQIKLPGSSAIQCYCPANGRLLGRVNPTTADGIDRAIAKAKEAQVEWAKTTFSQRRKVLQTMLKYILDNQETIARAACLDSGKTMVDASFGEILVTVEKLKWTILHGEKALRPEKRPTNFLMFYKANEVRYEPLGVVAACVSWK
ncbi:aldh-like protein [Lasallia pustulata]|uniref:aldehyde dehydrogenase (NAD(+)) n=1 Tax=Lasallia pustulata TaxID=136370 RepID=A0A1W5DBX5_9LECA|nr:aldh-like protein [Lasallia pustulata]